MKSSGLLVAVAFVTGCVQTPIMRVVRSGASDTGLLQNSGFEEARNDQPEQWRAYQQGFRFATAEGRAGSQAVVCENRSEQDHRGISQTLQLNRDAVAPLVVHGWSKAENVAGGTDNNYSIYVDIIYTDGTPLWGQTANFHCGTHDWEPREVVILPAKPVKTLTLYCLFRGHTGKVWFDDVTLSEIKAEGGAVLWQGVPVQGGAVSAAASDKVPSPSPAHFWARDVAANSDVYGFRSGACRELGLKMQTEIVAKQDHIVVSGRVSDVTGNDRAMTLAFALPLDATGWRWGDDIRRSRIIEGTGEYSTTVNVRCGATGTMSQYPLAAVWNDRTGVALALDMAKPAVYRLGYHAGTRQFFIAYDFGLVKEAGSADFRFVVYRFGPRWGFRAAFQKFTEVFPDYFTVRSQDQGIWMPFTDVSTVKGWEDFGFRYHEGNNNVPWDDDHSILSFRYTEPMTWWMPMPKEAARTAAEARRLRAEWARDKNNFHRRMAEAARTAGMVDEGGQPWLLFRNEPWCHGAVWSLNPNPHLPGELNAATVHWSDKIKEQLYGSNAKGRQDGEYLDSLEGYVTADLNYRREHFPRTTVPLTFATDTKRPALFKGLAVFEFTKWICDDVHRMGKLTFANGVPYRFTFLCPWLDVMGTETNWLSNRKYRPVSDALMSLWRTMCYRKPYLLLMNTDYDTFTPEMVEKYFQRALFYGMYPSMFSHNAAENPYWQNPKWYDRDRPLFKKYIPLVKRIAEAGWQPVTDARCDNPNIFVERYGPDATGATYFTLLNDTNQPQTGNLTIDTKALKLSEEVRALELLSGKALSIDQGRVQVELAPQGIWLIQVARN